HTTGVFGKVIIDGTRITVDRKDFEYEGIEYTLVKETPAGQPVDYTISVDTDSVVEKIRGFVDAYNSLISMLSGALSEARYGEGGGNSYQPLTDEQREGMSESEVEKWEEKSKLGLLRNDTLFVSMMTKIRLSVFNPIYTEYSSEYRDGKFTESFSAPLGSSLEALGIFTEKWQENGELHIDETKLRAAIENDINNVARVFSNQPPEVWGLDLKEAKYNETTEYAKRARLINDKTGGVMYKLLAVLDDYVRVTRDTSGAKGYLLERAGMASDQSDTSNVLTREIYEYNRRINSLWDRYDRIEAEKIKLLSRLETYVTQAGQQMSWITAQMSSGS
ncbi:MAG: flagellar filament capping protein FliD, partial [Clostridiales bacterium]|nr:flagellar filament capping protein FliD [Clostridiales bacterium]